MKHKREKTDVQRSSETGSVLILVVGLLALVGALIVLGSGGFATTDDQDMVRRTTIREQFVMHELAAYAQANNQLPCPADPSLALSGLGLPAAGFGFAKAACITPADAEGIIPYRTLGLSDRDARDGWGHYMTYRISLVMANPKSKGGNDEIYNNGGAAGLSSNDRIFMRCRRFGWFDGDVAILANVNPNKARFCCPYLGVAPFNAANDLTILTAALASGGVAVDPTIGRQGLYYQPVDTPVSNAETGGTQGALNPIPAGTRNEEMFAVAIISHGENGIGAFMTNGTTNRLGVTGGVSAAGTDEKINFTTPTSGANLVVDRPINTTPGATYFDDIVTWRTQIGLMGELGNVSCYDPWR